MNGTQAMREHINHLEALRRIMRWYIIADLTGNQDAKQRQVERLERLGEMPRVLKRQPPRDGITCPYCRGFGTVSEPMESMFSGRHIDCPICHGLKKVRDTKQMRELVEAQFKRDCPPLQEISPEMRLMPEQMGEIMSKFIIDTAIQSLFPELSTGSNLR